MVDKLEAYTAILSRLQDEIPEEISGGDGKSYFVFVAGAWEGIRSVRKQVCSVLRYIFEEEFLDEPLDVNEALSSFWDRIPSEYLTPELVPVYRHGYRAGVRSEGKRICEWLVPKIEDERCKTEKA